MSQSPTLPARRETETRLQLARVLRPLLDAATDWTGLASALAARGYCVSFADGRLMLWDTVADAPVCLGSDIECPLSSLVPRLGRPRLRLGRDGRSAALV
ncbi:hypothetical protein OCH239_06815 [Roseivivax halodurans JCM 10272]|uniref:Uncharacterized protein n=1 Tax=Roseivivax halodurans JCM 10272 TaxID=1449350 RepID=X7ED19_9RHOB|nr:hypothetical protein [Roseivivax halodurans]ETX13775.1 hypothetical protein OCH239_06815 [Roseivivax halodurans JCM 10272]